MMTYRIGEAADRIIVVTIDHTGMISWVVRSRSPHGDLETVAADQWPLPGFETEVSFDVRVHPGDSGSVEILPAPPSRDGTRIVIPLGVERPFFEGDFPVRPGSDGAYTQCESIRFRVIAGTVTWQVEGMTGRMIFSDRLPALSVALRLTCDNRGAIDFLSRAPLSARRAAPLFVLSLPPVVFSDCRT